jgi:UDP-N-acetylmuramoyl-tripeptide--D-alanyl-D-alanine ligase
VLAATGARLVRGEPASELSGVSTDTRSLKAGELFLALRGPNFDGNRFAAQAVAAGAPALLLAQAAGPEGEAPGEIVRALPEGVALLLHPDPRRALGLLGAWYRSTLDATVLGITGSCGKTTTKNIVRELFARLFPVVASPSSFNNDIGVPHTLCLADADTRLVALEMGTNHPGEMAALARIARPDAGIITNVGTSHLEGLGSLSGVAHEKGELAAALPPEGFLVLNASCRFRDELAARTRARVITFRVGGQGASAPSGGVDLEATDLFFHSGGTTFRLNGCELFSPLLGTHNVENLLAALCVALGLSIPIERLLPAVSAIACARSRMERIELDGLTLFDDCYNANPQSLRAAVRVLSGLHGYRRRVLVLGDMLELGELSAELHHELGREAARSGIDLLILVGTFVRAAAAGAAEGGLGAGAIVHLPSTELAAREVPRLLRAGDVALVKGSRAMGLERVVAAVQARWGGGGS